MGKKNNYVLAVDGMDTKLFETDDFRLDTLDIIQGKYRKDKSLKDRHGNKVIGEYTTTEGKVYIVYTNHKAIQI